MLLLQHATATAAAQSTAVILEATTTEQVYSTTSQPMTTKQSLAVHHLAAVKLHICASCLLL